MCRILRLKGIWWGVRLDRHLIPTVLAKLFCLGFLYNLQTFWYQQICLCNTFSKMYNITRFVWKNWMKKTICPNKTWKIAKIWCSERWLFNFDIKFHKLFYIYYPYFLHGWNYQNVSFLINQTNASNNICYGPVEPKMQWRMQCSQISGKSNNFPQISFSDLLIIRTKKQW